MWLNLQQHETIFEPSIKNKIFLPIFVDIRRKNVQQKSRSWWCQSSVCFTDPDGHCHCRHSGTQIYFKFILNRINFIICCRRTCSSVLKMPSLTLTVLLHFTMEWPWPAALSVVWPAFQPCAAQHRNDDPRINFKILFHFLSNFILYFFFFKVWVSTFSWPFFRLSQPLDRPLYRPWNRLESIQRIANILARQ